MQVPKAAHHSSLNNFNHSEKSVTFDNSYEQETLPITFDDATVVELNNDCNFYFDLQSLKLKIRQQLKITAKI